MEEAGFVKMAIWFLFESGPEVAGDEHLGEESHNKNVDSSDKYYHSESNVIISNVELPVLQTCGWSGKRGHWSIVCYREPLGEI